MKKILFFSCEPVGAEVLIPVIQNMLDDNDFEVIVLGYRYAIDRFEKKNIQYKTIEAIKKDDFTLLDKYKPDYIITSATSLPQKDMSEKYLWDNAKKKNIPTIAFLDQWQNYAIRFSGVSEDEYMEYQPNFINCINDIGTKEMLKLGFEGNKLVELGQPYLTNIKNEDKHIDREILLEKLKIKKNQEVILFVSEAIEEHFGKNRGYTQYETLEYLLSNDKFLENKQIIIKLHPKDDISKFNKYDNLILIQNEYSALEMINISNYIIGMTSIMLIEAYILEKKVLSIQLNAKDDLLLLSKYNYINKIDKNSSALTAKKFQNNGGFEYQFNYIKLKGLILENFN